jgi:Holliday junction resolvase YEN1
VSLSFCSHSDVTQVGLRGCGMTTAYSLARAGYGDDLLDAARTCTKPELEMFLEKWRKRLRTIFRYNDAGHLSRRQIALADHMSDSFPNLEVLLLYAKPLTSWSPGQKQPDTANWNPREVNLNKLAAICECSFTWGTSEGILSCFQEHVWPGMALHGLVKVC